ncbi:DUF1963 domain-containing protein [Novipirellula sp. SH528]|uniref:DUF1963 domain-containing protein n=1 Tax=Novipirellula sp. SH528 TaxID=3454466 RepID=UPI003FA03423
MFADTVREKLKRHARETYVAKLKRGGGSPAASKIGGVPWLDTADDWPLCGHCDNPMQFLFQLNLEETSRLTCGPSGTGLFQVFYCTTSDTYCDELGDDPFSPYGMHLCARHYRPKADSAAVKKPRSANSLKPKTIVEWSATTEYPSYEDAIKLKGVSFTDEETNFICLEDDSLTQMGEKLGGWPGFIQGADYPACPTCSQPMKFVFQLASFGSRIAFLFRCSKHRSTLAFSWQCS